MLKPWDHLLSVPCIGVYFRLNVQMSTTVLPRATTQRLHNCRARDFQGLMRATGSVAVAAVLLLPWTTTGFVPCGGRHHMSKPTHDKFRRYLWSMLPLVFTPMQVVPVLRTNAHPILYESCWLSGRTRDKSNSSATRMSEG